MLKKENKKSEVGMKRLIMFPKIYIFHEKWYPSGSVAGRNITK